MYPKVSIMILNWNGKEDTIECLESLGQVDYPNYEIVLVDNGSTDGSVEYFRDKYPAVEIIENEDNLGFAEGNNVGIKKVVERGTDYILLQNNDTIVDPHFLKELVRVIESDTDIGVVGPTIFHYNERKKIQAAGAKVFWYIGRACHLGKNKVYDKKRNKIKEVDYITGCSLLARSELFDKIGYLNKDYFAYWEETDWCVRARKGGYKILYVPEAKIWHKGGSTSGKISGFCEYHITRNMFWFMKEHATKVQYMSFLIYFFSIQFLVSTAKFMRYNNRSELLSSFLNGIKDGIKKYPGL